MKKYLTLNNALFLLGMGYLLFTAVPLFFANISREGETIPVQAYLVIESGMTEKKIKFPPEKRSIAIFWATWCAPCKVEMKRLASSVEDGKIPRGEIIAINPFETPEVIRPFLRENPYPFTFIEDNGISQKLDIRRTPTTLFLENKKIVSLSSGLSFIGIWKAESFLP